MPICSLSKCSLLPSLTVPGVHFSHVSMHFSHVFLFSHLPFFFSFLHFLVEILSLQSTSWIDRSFSEMYVSESNVHCKYIQCNFYTFYYLITVIVWFEQTGFPVCPNVFTTRLWQWGFLQCLPFSWATLRGKHCRHPNVIMGVVDMFRQCFKQNSSNEAV